MPRLDLKGIDRFASGACRYYDYPLDDPYNRRIVIPIRLVGSDEIITAVVDTGSPWCVLNPMWASRLAKHLIFYHQDVLWIRGMRLRGSIWQVQIELQADLGIPHIVDATAFIPDETIDWPLPDFLGLDGFLDRIRFAVDPEENLFYFGALGDA